MSLSSHVLDATRGVPATGLRIRWERWREDLWQHLADAVTDADGRVSEWGGAATAPTTTQGVHRLVFDSGGYFARQDVETFYPEVVVVFDVVDPDAHHHVPLLLSPFAYSTYRGS
jgi:5-hydroxyisourate hydrolase